MTSQTMSVNEGYHAVNDMEEDEEEEEGEEEEEED